MGVGELPSPPAGGPVPATAIQDHGRFPTVTVVRRIEDVDDDLHLSVVCDAEGDTVGVRGELTVATAGRLRLLKLRRDPTGTRPVRIDLAGVSALDAAGVAAVTAFARQPMLAGRPLTVIKPVKPGPAGMVAMTGVIDLLHTVPSDPQDRGPDRPRDRRRDQR
ncbi:MAG: STAS domain-containing protein [Acidimicrobiales bacterium]